MEKKNMKARNDRLDIRSSRLQFTILADQARVSAAGMKPIKHTAAASLGPGADERGRRRGHGGRPAPSEPGGAARRRLTLLAGLAGLLSPAEKLPDGKSRPGAGVSGTRQPRGAPAAGHTETSTRRAAT